MENTTTNNSIETITSDLKLDDLGLAEKVIYSIVSAAFLAFGVIAVVCLNRNRTTPETAKFLSSGLIIFDELAVVSFTVRKFISNEDINIFVQVFGVGWVFLAYITIGLMSLERLFIFCAPYVYLRNVTTQLAKTVVYATWIIVSIVYIFVRYGLCYIVYSDVVMADIIGRCNAAAFTMYKAAVVIIISVSLVVYFKILFILKSQTSVDNKSTTLGLLRYYRSTSLVLVYIITITVTSIFIMFIISLKLDKETVRVWTDILNMVNCVMDPCTYVLWYRETRMEILKLFACLNSKIDIKIQQMKLEIFGIVVSDHWRHNKVHPSLGNTETMYI